MSRPENISKRKIFFGKVLWIDGFRVQGEKMYRARFACTKAMHEN